MIQEVEKKDYVATIFVAGKPVPLTRKQARLAFPPHVEEMTLAGKIASAVGAIAGERLDDEQVHERLTICSSCVHLNDDNGKWYCQGCSCPAWSMSELRKKAKMSKARCPLRKWPKVK